MAGCRRQEIIHTSGMQMNTMQLRAKVESLQALEEFVLQGAHCPALSSNRIQDVRLVLEELFTNIAFYAYPGGEGSVRVACYQRPDRCFCIELRDEGIPFNPLEFHVSGLDRDFNDREIGGLGIHLVKQLVSEIHYLREDRSNALTVCFGF
jgi:serine/threonine-protein kinase RsbW